MTQSQEGRFTASRRELYQQLHDFFSTRSDIAAAIVFGSVARNEARTGSDVDIGVLFTREAFQKGVNQGRLMRELIEHLGQSAVDLAILNTASPLLLHRVIRDGHVVFAKDQTVLAEFTIHAIQQYEDTRPLRELQRDYLRRRLAAFATREKGR